MSDANFEGIFDGDGESVDFDRSMKLNRSQAARRRNFRKKIEHILSLKKQKFRKLKALAFEDNDINSFNSAELMSIYSGFQDSGAFRYMIRLYDESDNQEFKKSEIVRERLALAYNKLGFHDKAVDVCKTLLSEGNKNGEVYGELGVAYAKKYEIVDDYIRSFSSGDKGAVLRAAKKYAAAFPDDVNSEFVHENLVDSLSKMKQTNEKGFMETFEYAPGIHSVHHKLETGNMREATSLAKIVYMTCLRDNAKEDNNNYWRAEVMLESAIIGGFSSNHIKDATKKLISMKDAPKWERAATYHSLRQVEQNFIDAGRDTRAISGVIKTIKEAYEAERAGKEYNFSEREKVLSSKDMALFDVVDSSYSYRGFASNFVGANFVKGNFDYDGQLPDHTVSRKDWQRFEHLLTVPLKDIVDEKKLKNISCEPNQSLGDIKRTGTFLRAVDVVVRSAFGTDEQQLEDLNSVGHKRFDQKVQGLIKLSGIKDKKGADSRTNISVSMALGLGDCRHHAQAKQLLFDTWQRKKMNRFLKKAYESSLKGDAKNYIENIKNFLRVSRIELRTIDVKIKAPVQMQEKYKPIKEDGIHLLSKDGSFHEIEDHTMNILVLRNNMGKPVSVTFSDSFYQSRYNLSRGKVSSSSLKLTDKGDVVIPAKTIEAKDKNGFIRDVPVELVPTSYSGKRDEVAKDEHGETLLMGLSVEENFSLSEALRTRKYAGRLEDIRVWYANKQDKKKYQLPRLQQIKNRKSSGR